MSASVFVGRVSGLAVALGVGFALADGAGMASASPVEGEPSPTTQGPDAGAPPRSEGTSVAQRPWAAPDRSPSPESSEAPTVEAGPASSPAQRATRADRLSRAAQAEPRPPASRTPEAVSDVESSDSEPPDVSVPPRAERRGGVDTDPGLDADAAAPAPSAAVDSAPDVSAAPIVDLPSAEQVDSAASGQTDTGLAAPPALVVTAVDLTPSAVASASVVAPAAATAEVSEGEGVLESVLGPLSQPGPGGPVGSALAWTMAAVARREIGEQPTALTALAAAVSSGEPVGEAPSESATDAAAETDPPVINPIAGFVEQITAFVTQIVTFVTDFVTQVITVITELVQTVIGFITPGPPANSNPSIGTLEVGTPDATTGVVTGTVTADDSDGDTLSFSAPSTTAKGSVVINAGNGEFVYTPTAAARHAAAADDTTDADRADSFTITVTDGRDGSASVAVTVPISPANALPVASAPTVGEPDAETGVVTGTLNVNDADVDLLSYAASGSALGVLEIDPATGAFTYAPTDQARHDAAITDKRIGSVSGFELPAGVAVSPDGTQVFVADRLAGTVSVVDVATTAVVDTITGFQIPAGVAVHPDGVRIYVSGVTGGTDIGGGVIVGAQGAVSVIDTVTGTVTSLPGEFAASADRPLAVHPDGDRLYATGLISLGDDGFGGSLEIPAVVEIDTATNTVTSAIELRGPVAMAVHPDGSRLFVLHGDGLNLGAATLSVVDTTTREVENTPFAVAFGGALALSADGSQLFLVDGLLGATIVIDTATYEVSPGTFGLLRPEGIAFSGSGSDTTAFITETTELNLTDTGIQATGRLTLVQLSGPTSDTFTVTVTDGHGGTVVIPLTVPIGPANTAPTGATAAVGLPDPETGVITGTVSAVDADGDALTYWTLPIAPGGSVLIEPSTGEFVYTPFGTGTGTSDTLTFGIADGHGGTATVSILGDAEAISESVSASATADAGGPALVDDSVMLASRVAAAASADPFTMVIEQIQAFVNRFIDVVAQVFTQVVAVTTELVQTIIGFFTPGPSAGGSALLTTLFDAPPTLSAAVSAEPASRSFTAVEYDLDPLLGCDGDPICGDYVTGYIGVFTPNPDTGIVTGRAFGNHTSLSVVNAPSKGSVAIGRTTQGLAYHSALLTFTYTPTIAARRKAGNPGATEADKSDSFVVRLSGPWGSVQHVISVRIVPTGGGGGVTPTPVQTFSSDDATVSRINDVLLSSEFSTLVGYGSNIAGILGLKPLSSLTDFVGAAIAGYRGDFWALAAKGAQATGSGVMEAGAKNRNWVQYGVGAAITTFGYLAEQVSYIDYNATGTTWDYMRQPSNWGAVGQELANATTKVVGDLGSAFLGGLGGIFGLKW